MTLDHHRERSEAAAFAGHPPGAGSGGDLAALLSQVGTLQEQVASLTIILQGIVKTVSDHAATIAQIEPLTPLIPLVEGFLSTARGKATVLAAKLTLPK